MLHKFRRCPFWRIIGLVCVICCLCPALLATNLACPWGLEVRWCRVNDADLGKTLQQAHLSTHLSTAASSFNTLYPCPIGPQKVSILNSSSWLAGIVCISNPWSFRWSSTRFSCRRCFCSCTILSVYLEAACHSCYISTLLFLDFDSLVGAGAPLPWHCWSLEDSQYTVLYLS